MTSRKAVSSILISGRRHAARQSLPLHPGRLKVVIPVRVRIPRITRVEPSSPQASCRRLRITVVLLHHVRSADNDLTCPAGRQRVALLIEYPALLSR